MCLALGRIGVDLSWYPTHVGSQSFLVSDPETTQVLCDVGLFAAWHLHLIAFGLIEGLSALHSVRFDVSFWCFSLIPSMTQVSILQMHGGAVLPSMVMIRALDARAGIVETRSVAVSVDLLQELLPCLCGIAVGAVRSGRRPRHMNGSLTRCTV